MSTLKQYRFFSRLLNNQVTSSQLQQYVSNNLGDWILIINNETNIRQLVNKPSIVNIILNSALAKEELLKAYSLVELFKSPVHINTVLDNSTLLNAILTSSIAVENIVNNKFALNIIKKSGNSFYSTLLSTLNAVATTPASNETVVELQDYQNNLKYLTTLSNSIFRPVLYESNVAQDLNTSPLATKSLAISLPVQQNINNVIEYLQTYNTKLGLEKLLYNTSIYNQLLTNSTAMALLANNSDAVNIIINSKELLSKLFISAHIQVFLNNPTACSIISNNRRVLVYIFSNSVAKQAVFNSLEMSKAIRYSAVAMTYAESIATEYSTELPLNTWGSPAELFDTTSNIGWFVVSVPQIHMTSLPSTRRVAYYRHIGTNTPTSTTRIRTTNNALNWQAQDFFSIGNQFIPTAATKNIDKSAIEGHMFYSFRVQPTTDTEVSGNHTIKVKAILMG